MKRIITMALAVIMLLGCLPVAALATEETTMPQAEQTPLGMASIGAAGYQTMTTSQEMMDMLKVTEGFHAEPYWDYAQWTIGYGCYAGSGSEPTITSVTPEQAEELLREQLKKYEGYVNDYCRKIGKQPSQNQFDALLSFTYNLGSSWTYGSRLDTWLRNPSTEMELVNAMGQWVRAGGDILYGLVQRRVREAIVFLKGEYSLHTRPTEAHNVKSDLPVISNSSLPYYASVIYQYDFDTANVAKGGGHAVAYFPIGGFYDGLHVPTSSPEGCRFAGWKTTRISGSSTDSGTMVTADTVVEKNLELTAVWTMVAPPLIGDDMSSTPDFDLGSDETNDDVTIPVPDSGTDSDAVELPFADVAKDAWYREYVSFVYDREYMNGVSETMFEPESTMTRGMLVTVLYRIDGSPEVTDEQLAAFDDVAAEQYYAKAVAWAKANGIVNGVSDRIFDPEASVTRQEAVAIFYRYCVEYCQLSQDTGEALHGFADIDTVAEYALAPMQWAVNVGVINGTDVDNMLCLNPQGKLQRCESAAILTRCVTDILSVV